MIKDFNIAQLNISKLKYSIDDPNLKDFTDYLDHINLLAEKSIGFVWRLKDDTGNATTIPVYDDPLIIANMSVWDSMENLFNFTYKSEHVNFFKRQREWFDQIEKPYLVLWWIPHNQIPSLEEGKQRLNYLKQNGPTYHSFTFKEPFAKDEYKFQTNIVKEEVY